VLKGDKKNPLEIARACYDFTLRVLYYNGESKVPVVPVIVVLGDGKCVDYANVMTTLLLACGIPAKNQYGVVGRNNERVGLHAWVEFLVPLKNGGFKWLMSDPTWGDEGDADDFFLCKNYVDKISNDKKNLEHFYMIGFDVYVEHAEYVLKHVQHWSVKNAQH